VCLLWGWPWGQRKVKLQTVCSLSGMSSGQKWLSIEYITLPNIWQHQTDEINARIGVWIKKEEMKDWTRMWSNMSILCHPQFDRHIVSCVCMCVCTQTHTSYKYIYCISKPMAIACKHGTNKMQWVRSFSWEPIMLAQDPVQSTEGYPPQNRRYICKMNYNWSTVCSEV